MPMLFNGGRIVEVAGVVLTKAELVTAARTVANEGIELGTGLCENAIAAVGATMDANSAPARSNPVERRETEYFTQLPYRPRVPKRQGGPVKELISTRHIVRETDES